MLFNVDQMLVAGVHRTEEARRRLRQLGKNSALGPLEAHADAHCVSMPRSAATPRAVVRSPVEVTAKRPHNGPPSSARARRSYGRASRALAHSRRPVARRTSGWRASSRRPSPIRSTSIACATARRTRNLEGLRPLTSANASSRAPGRSPVLVRGRRLGDFQGPVPLSRAASGRASMTKFDSPTPAREARRVLLDHRVDGPVTFPSARRRPCLRGPPVGFSTSQRRPARSS